MQKRVQRKEVTVHIGGKEASTELLSQLPDEGTLAARYGLQLQDQLSDSDDIVGSDSTPPGDGQQQQQQRLEQHVQKEAQLVQRLEAKNRQIEQLCVMLEALQPAPGVDPERVRKAMAAGDAAADGEHGIDLRDVKIVSMAKKAHNLQMQLNKERASNEKLRQQLNAAERGKEGMKEELAMAQALAARGGAALASKTVYNRNAQSAAAVASEKDDAQQSIVSLQKQLKDTGKVAEEQKRRLALAADENKQLSRALQRELGEGVAVEQAVSGGWRGRAQQIVMLKAKIKKLEADGLSSAGPRSAGRSTALSDVDAKAEDDLVAMSHERRQIVEALTEERVQLIGNIQQLEKKSQAQKARIQILETDSKKLRENLQLVIDKSENDDKLLGALRNEVQRLRGQQQQQVTAQSIRDSSSTSAATGHLSRTRQSGLAVIGGGTSKEQQPTAAEDSYNPSEAVIAQQQAEIEKNLSELQRLRRLCQNQADQLDSQDSTIRQLKRQLHS